MYKFLFVVLTSISIGAFAQVKDPVKWTTSSKKVSDGNYEVVLTATMPKPWHIYSQFTGDGGPIPTTFKFAKNPLISLSGAVKEVGKLKQEHDNNFDTQVKYFADKVDFMQTIKVKGNVKTNAVVTVEYMTCDDSQCLPPVKKTFSVALK